MCLIALTKAQQRQGEAFFLQKKENKTRGHRRKTHPPLFPNSAAAHPEEVADAGDVALGVEDDAFRGPAVSLFCVF